MKRIDCAACIACIILLTGCATYHISTQSLCEQFANSKPEKKVNFVIVFPLFFPGVVNGNDVREITCLDKSEQAITLPVTNHTGVRITRKDGTRKTFYFDTLLIKDSIINGKKSHFIGLPVNPINLNDNCKN